MKRVVTIDFDETLATEKSTGWGKSLVPYQTILDLITKEHKQGSEIHIVSFRSEKERPEEFIDKLKSILQGDKVTGKYNSSIQLTTPEEKQEFLKKIKLNYMLKGFIPGDLIDSL